MIIFCLKCNKLNQVKDGEVSDRGTIRCRFCGHVFPYRGEGQGLPRTDTTKVLKVNVAVGDESLTQDQRTDLAQWARRTAEEVDHHGPLSVLVDAQNDERYLLWKFRTYIGRTSCDVNLNDPDVSRQHAVVEKYGDKHLLKDLHSTNGTFLNGQTTSMHLLKDSDSLRFGRTVLRFYSLESPEPAR